MGAREEMESGGVLSLPSADTDDPTVFFNIGGDFPSSCAPSRSLDFTLPRK